MSESEADRLEDLNGRLTRLFGRSGAFLCAKRAEDGACNLGGRWILYFHPTAAHRERQVCESVRFTTFTELAQVCDYAIEKGGAVPAFVKSQLLARGVLCD